MQHNLETQKHYPPMPGATIDLQCEVTSWFAAGHEVMWIPIYEVADTSSGIADATDLAERHGGPRMIHDETDFIALPLGIKGWLFPAHLDDTDVICVREDSGEISFGHLHHPGTGDRLTWRYPTEREL